MIVIPTSERLTMVNNMTAATGSLNGVKVMLYQNDLTPSADSVLTDFVPCDFAGAVASAPVVWGPAFLNALKQAVTVSTSTVTFRPTDSLKPQNAQGYFVTDGAGAKLIYAEKFDSPVALNTVNDACVLVPTFAFGG